jgi:hypothetical protein
MQAAQAAGGAAGAAAHAAAAAAQAQAAAAAAHAAAAAAPASGAARAARAVGLRDCVTWLARDGRASPRLLAAAGERLRRAEQPAGGGAPATAPLLGPLTPRW